MVETIIVGGGIVGAVVADKLQDMNKDVKIIEKERKVKQLNSNRSVWSIIPPLCGDLMEKCLSSIDYYVQLSHKYGVIYKEMSVISDKQIGREISMNKLKEIEPDITVPESTKMYIYERALYLDGEKLLEKVTKSVMINEEVIGYEIKDNKITKLHLSSGENISVNGNVIFSTGYLTIKLFGIKDLEVYKGHLISSSSSFTLNNILFYKGKIFLKRRGSEVIISSDAEKTTDNKINYEKVKDAVNTVNSIYPLSHRILVSVGFRTASSSKKYVIEKIAENALVITGFRFGFAMAPFIVDEALGLLKSGSS